MQILNLSFRRFLFRKLGFLEPGELHKLERLTALRHQLSEEKRLSMKPFDPEIEKIFQARLKDPDLDKNQKEILNNRLSTITANPNLQKQLNDLDVQVNEILQDRAPIINAYHRVYMASRKVALHQNHFFQIPLRNVIKFLNSILTYKWVQLRKHCCKTFDNNSQFNIL